MATALIDALIGDRPEGYGEYFGCFSITRERWWTDAVGPLKLVRHRFILANTLVQYQPDTLTHVTPCETGFCTEQEYRTYVLWRATGELMLSTVQIRVEGPVGEEEIDAVYAERLDGQKRATSEQWKGFLSLLEDGFNWPEDAQDDL